MATVPEREQWRRALLRAMYDQCGGDPGLTMVIEIAAVSADVPPDALDGVVNYLAGRGFLALRAGGGLAELTATGVDQVEDELRREAEVAVLTPAEHREVEAVLGQLVLAVERGELAPKGDDAVVFDIEREVVEAELHSPRPNRGVVKAALASIGEVVKNAAGNAIGTVAGGVALFEVLKRLH